MRRVISASAFPSRLPVGWSCIEVSPFGDRNGNKSTRRTGDQTRYALTVLGAKSSSTSMDRSINP
jgi:hypothetical protein